MTAPTEAEIREAVELAFEDNGTLNVAGELGDAFANTARALHGLYATDVPGSWLEDLNATASEAIEPIRDRALAACKEAIVAAGLRFALYQYPEAPRAPRRLTIHHRGLGRRLTVVR